MLKKFKQLKSSNSTAYFTAEIGINHNGELKNVFKLIQAAKLAGCDAVKFQKRNPKDCVPKILRGEGLHILITKKKWNFQKKIIKR